MAETFTHRHTVSVIISCWTEDRLQDIREAIASVASQMRSGDEVLVVVDNNTSLYEALEHNQPGRVSVLLHLGLRGLSAARNTAIPRARGYLVAFLDDDAIASAGWLDAMRSPFGDPAIVAVGGYVQLRWSGRRPHWIPAELDWIMGGGFSWLPREPRVVRNPHGCNMCLRRSVFDSVGLFNPALGRVGSGTEVGEEAEFFLRLDRVLRGTRVLYHPQATIVHKVSRSRSTLGHVLRRSYAEGIAKGRIVHEQGFRKIAVLAQEREYLVRILGRAIPSRMIRFYQPRNMLQSAVIILSTVAIGAGYVVGSLGARGLKDNARPCTG